MPKNTDETAGYSWFWERLDVYLGTKLLKQTKQRKTIINEFLKLGGHVPAEDLHDVVRSGGHNIGLATIYRTLNLLTEAGLVEKKQFTDGRWVFEVNEPGSHHDHLICLKCSKIVEFENDAIEELQKKVAKKHGFRLVDHNLDLFGYCPDCVT